MKLRYFYKINHKREPIPGSNVRRKSKPGKQWLEILNPCCFPTDIDCTCDFRYFVQLDGVGKAVDGSLIKRKNYPEGLDSIRYMEVDWKSACCYYENVTVNFPNLSVNALKVTFVGLNGQGTYTTGFRGATLEAYIVNLPFKGKYDVLFETTIEFNIGSICLLETVLNTSNFGAALCRSGVPGISTRSNVSLDKVYTIV